MVGVELCPVYVVHVVLASGGVLFLGLMMLHDVPRCLMRWAWLTLCVLCCLSLLYSRVRTLVAHLSVSAILGRSFGVAIHGNVAAVMCCGLVSELGMMLDRSCKRLVALFLTW